VAESRHIAQCWYTGVPVLEVYYSPSVTWLLAEQMLECYVITNQR